MDDEDDLNRLISQPLDRQSENLLLQTDLTSFKNYNAIKIARKEVAVPDTLIENTHNFYDN